LSCLGGREVFIKNNSVTRPTVVIKRTAFNR
jgi:hypothetical protein